MSNKNLAILGIIAAAMALWAFVQSRLPGSAGQGVFVATSLIQGLNPDDVAQITISSAAKTITLKRADNGFVVTEKGDYTAQTSKINKLFTDVLDIQVKEPVTSDTANHADLQVSEDKAKNVVKFLGKDGKVITGIIIGKRGDNGDCFVRMVASDTVFASQNAPWIADTETGYMDTQLLNVKEEQVSRVMVKDPNGSYTLAAEPNGGNINLKEMPAGKKLKEGDYKQVFSALANLDFEDVLPEAKAVDLPFKNTYTCNLKDSSQYGLDIAKKGDRYYVKCKAVYTDTQEVMKEDRVESKDELKKKEAKLLAHDAVEKFNKLHGGWVYQVSEWQAKNLTKKLADLVEDIKPEPKQVKAEPNTPDANKAPNKVATLPAETK